MRRKILFLVLVLSVCLISLSFQSQRDDSHKRTISGSDVREVHFSQTGRAFGQHERLQFASDQVLVKFKSDISAMEIEAIISAYRTYKIKKISGLNIYQLQIPQGFSVEETVYAYSKNPDVEFVEPNYVARITETPNDSLFSYQYALNNTGQAIGIPGSPTGRARADIKATAAWDETIGLEATVIAIVDTGVEILHPDLQDKIISGGRDFVNSDFDADDDNGHGTHVAGIAAADTHNTEGIAGVAWDCRILPVKVMDADGSGLYSWIIDGIRWAADNEVHVINLSLGGDADADSLRAAITYAVSKGIVCVASGGNDGSSVLYPAAYDNCLAVAATDYNDDRPDWSNSGPEIDVAAPGERVLSTIPTWFFGEGSLPYAFGFGTSMSAPHVAGLAALIKSMKPWLSAQEIMNIIRYTADDVNSSGNPGKDEFIGYGRINMEKALVPIKISAASENE
ncbi:MAG: peptidase S8 [Candidatus Aminicenantes bacterium]|nr:peptidase S8 [Candidatus Aminicenantes bacterium]